MADFKIRLALIGATATLWVACRRVARAMQNRQDYRGLRLAPIAPAATQPQRGMDTEARAEWAAEWLGTGMSEEALECDWRARWQQQLDKAMQERPGRDIEPADSPEFTEVALAKYNGLRKHKSLLLV